MYRGRVAPLRGADSQTESIQGHMTTRAKITLLILVAVPIALFVWWWRNAHAPVANAASKGANIILLGDSLGAAYGVGEDAGFVALTEKRFGVTILNASIAGSTTADGLDRLQKDVLDRDPKVVIIELGGNDLLQSVPRDDTRHNLEAMIQAVQKAGAAVVLVGADGPLGAGGLTTIMRDLSHQYGTACVPNILSGMMSDFRLMQDQVHPNAEGQKIMADRLVKELSRRLPKIFKEK